MEFVPPIEHQDVQKVTNSKPYCRLCLKPALKNQMVCLGDYHDVNYPSRTPQFKRNKILQTEMYVKMIQTLMPNFDYKLIFNPVMCPTCSNRLQRASEFVEQCMNNQNTIRRYKELFSSSNEIISCEEVAKNQWKIPVVEIKHRSPIPHKVYPSKKNKTAKPTETVQKVEVKEEVIETETIKIEPLDLIKQEENASHSIKTEFEIKNEPNLIDNSSVIGANSLVRLAPVQYCATVPQPIQFVQQIPHNYVNDDENIMNPLMISTNNLPVMSSDVIDLQNNQT